MTDPRPASERKLYYLYRCLLAEWFTRPSVLAYPRPTAKQIQSLKDAGLLSIKGGTTRLTEAGKAELSIAGIDTRNSRAAEASWMARSLAEKAAP